MFFSYEIETNLRNQPFYRKIHVSSIGICSFAKDNKLKPVTWIWSLSFPTCRLGFFYFGKLLEQSLGVTVDLITKKWIKRAHKDTYTLARQNIIWNRKKEINCFILEDIILSMQRVLNMSRVWISPALNKITKRFDALSAIWDHWGSVKEFGRRN